MRPAPGSVYIYCTAYGQVSLWMFWKHDLRVEGRLVPKESEIIILSCIQDFRSKFKKIVNGIFVFELISLLALMITF